MTSIRRTRSHGAKHILAIPILLGLIATSCGGGESASTTVEEPTGTTVASEPSSDEPIVVTLPPEVELVPVFGGTLRYGLEADVDGINPTTSALSAPGLMMANAVFDTLAAITTDGEAVPFLAESFTPSDDFMHWTVKVREGIVFHDGTPLNADAILANFEAQRANGLVGLAVRPFFPETGATEKIDEFTVQFNLLDANMYFPASINGQLGMVASPTWLAAALVDATLNQAPVGTGPFSFDSRSVDSVTKFVKNPTYWGGDVYLDAVEFYPVPDSATRVELLFAGQLDAMQTTDAASVLDIQADTTIQNVLDETGEESFAMINSSVAPFDDIRARKALAFATPRQDYIDLFGLGVNRGADQRFTPESPYYNPDVKQEADDPEAAIALAAEYCAERGTEENTVLATTTCTDGKINMEFQWSGPSVTATRIADLFDEGWSVAFNVTFNELLQSPHIAETAFGQYNVNTWRQFGADDPGPDNLWLLCRAIGGISLNWPRFCDEERDALLIQAIGTSDQAERIALYQQTSQMIHDAYTYVFLTHTLWANSFVESVHGVCERTSPEGDLLKCASNGRTWFSSVWID